MKNEPSAYRVWIRSILPLLAYSLLLAANTGLASSAHAAPKPKVYVATGAACTPKGRTATLNGIQFSCVAMGKKLVWMKASATTNQNQTTSDLVFPPNTPAPGRSCPNEGGKTVVFGGSITCTHGTWMVDPGQTFHASKPSQPATTKPTPAKPQLADSSTPQKIVLDGDGIATVANNDVQKILTNASSPTSTYVIHQSPHLSQPLVDAANSVFPTAVKFWESVYAPQKPVDVVMGYWSDGAWLQEADKAAGDTPNGYGSLADWVTGHPQSDWPSVSGSGSHAGTPVNGVIPKIIIIVTGPDVITRPGAYTTPAHEYTMNVMQELDLNVFSQSPCWFNEGMAQFYGATLAYSSPTTYLQKRREMLLDTEYGKYPFGGQRSNSEWAAGLAASEGQDCAPTGGAWLGQLAVEKMIAMKGTAGIIALLRDLNQTASFATSFKNIYGLSQADFYTLASSHISSTVSDLLGNTRTPAPEAQQASPSANEEPNSAAIQTNILKQVADAIASSTIVPTSSLIEINAQPGALTTVQLNWIRGALQFISYLSPPTNGAKWNLVFPKTMDWFLQNWDLSSESQHYKDMFANNTAEQLIGSVHSHGTSVGGWDASFFVSQDKNWFDSDWQMRFIAQLLKPVGYSDGSLGVTVPDWFVRTFAYPIGAAYSQITNGASYANIHQSWLDSLQKVVRPFDMSIYENPATFLSGSEVTKMPGALADEYLLSTSGILKSLNFISDTSKSGGNWESQLSQSFGISKADLYAKIASLLKS